MKKKSFAFVLAIMLTFGIFALAGCGEVKIDTLKKSYDKLNETYEHYSAQIFDRDQNGEGVVFDGVKTLYKIKTYGGTVDNFIKEEQNKLPQDEQNDPEEELPKFSELSDFYNSALVYSSKYIEDNIGYILALKSTDKQSKDAIKSLNDSITNYTSYLPTFVAQKKDFQEYFENRYTPDTSVRIYGEYLQDFKLSFGKLVSMNIQISSDLAWAIEETRLFSVLSSEDVSPVPEDTLILKEYIRSKILPVFTKFTLDEVQNNFNLYGTFKTPTKTRIINLIKSIDAQFDDYKQIFVTNTKTLKAFATSKEIKDVLEFSQNFMTEVEDFYTSAQRLNVYDLSTQYSNKLDDYLGKNKYAEIYLEKMEQFVENTLPQFMSKAESLLYNAAA